MEIVCLGSSVEDYDHFSWKIGREYDSRFLNDIEIGLKNWENVSASIDPTCWAFAKEYESPPDSFNTPYESFVSPQDEGEFLLPNDKEIFSTPDETDYVSNLDYGDSVPPVN